MTEGTIPVVLEYQHPDNTEPTRYSVWMLADAVGAVLLAMDLVSECDDLEEIAEATKTIQEAF